MDNNKSCGFKCSTLMNLYPTRALAVLYNLMTWVHLQIINTSTSHGASLFISSDGNSYLEPFSLSLFLFLAHPNLLLAQAPLLWNCLGTVGDCRLLSARVCPGLPANHTCVRFWYCVQLATCCEVFHVSGACLNASLLFTAKLSLIVRKTGNALAAFMNVKYSAPSQAGL